MVGLALWQNTLWLLPMTGQAASKGVRRTARLLQMLSCWTPLLECR